jgi:hypothetical protein
MSEVKRRYIEHIVGRLYCLCVVSSATVFRQWTVPAKWKLIFCIIITASFKLCIAFKITFGLHLVLQEVSVSWQIFWNQFCHPLYFEHSNLFFLLIQKRPKYFSKFVLWKWNSKIFDASFLHLNPRGKTMKEKNAIVPWRKGNNNSIFM